MPLYDYECPVHGIFEEQHSYKIKLEICPHCKEEGKDQEIKKLISLPSRGIVELTGQELVTKLKSDAKQIQREAAKDEKKYANLLGEAKYESLQKQMDRRNR